MKKNEIKYLVTVGDVLRIENDYQINLFDMTSIKSKYIEALNEKIKFQKEEIQPFLNVVDLSNLTKPQQKKANLLTLKLNSLDAKIKVEKFRYMYNIYNAYMDFECLDVTFEELEDFERDLEKSFKRTLFPSGNPNDEDQNDTKKQNQRDGGQQ